MKRMIPLFVCLGLSFSAAGCNGTFSKTLKKYGMIRTHPPKASLAPGAIVAVKRHGGGASFDIVCWPAQAFPGAAEPQKNPTMSMKLNRELKAEMGLEAKYLELIKADAKFKHVKKISFSLEKAHVIENSIADLAAVADKRLPACAQAISEVAGDGRPVYYVLQALQADVIYTVHTETDASTGASVKLDSGTMAGLAAELGGSVGSVSDMTITGKGLHWGVRIRKVKPRAKDVPFAAVKADSLEDLPGDLLELFSEDVPVVPEKSAADEIVEKSAPPPDPSPDAPAPGNEGDDASASDENAP